MSAQPRTIRVTGMGRARARQDVVTVVLGVEVRHAEAAAAHAEASRRARDVLAAVAALVPLDDVSTQSITLEPVHEYRETGQRLIGYAGRHTLEVIVRDAGRAGAVLDAAVTGGASIVTGLTLSTTDEGEARARARRLAYEDAGARAAQLAAAAGVELGDVVSIYETPTADGPRPFEARAELAVSTPIVSGSGEVAVSLIVTFAVRREPEPS